MTIVKTSNKTSNKKFNLPIRPRRLRLSSSLRDMVAETGLMSRHLVYPLFIKDEKSCYESIKTMPGVFRLGENELFEEVKKATNLGIASVSLFPVVENSLKSSDARESFNSSGLVQKRISFLKEHFPNLVIFSDVALDPYSSDGHDGLVQDGKVLNDETLEVLAKQALSQAKAGVDYVAPSDMMDGRVSVIREALDAEGFENVGILSYAAKYASAFYGPFRDALDSAPRFGDKKTYQMDFRNKREAIREVLLDIEEGADMLMVKPALSYLDVISSIRHTVHLPIAAYSVSGEYAMLQFAARAGALDLDKAVLESHVSMKRAGADLIFTYFAVALAEQLSRQ